MKFKQSWAMNLTNEEIEADVNDATRGSEHSETYGNLAEDHA